MSKKQSITIGIDASRAFVNDPAGPEYYSWHIIKNLAEIDHENHYILYTKSGQLPNITLPHNFEVKKIKFRKFWTQLGLAWETCVNPPDVLFIPAHTLPLATRLIYSIGNTFKVLPQMRFLVTIHGLEGKYLPQSSNIWAHIHRNWSIGWAIRLADHLLAVSNDTYKDIQTTYNIPNYKITVVHEGVDFEKFSKSSPLKKSTKSKYHITNNYILFVGTIQPRKNLRKLIKSFSRVVNKFEDLQLVIAGKLGWMYDEVLQAPKSFMIEDKVVFTGRVEESDLPGLYKSAQVFVLPSITEGFGLPILEAQASGVPVVCSNRGALPEVAGNGAIFVNPFKTNEITVAIKSVLQNKALRKRLVERGVKNAAQSSWKLTTYNTLNIIKKIAG